MQNRALRVLRSRESDKKTKDVDPNTAPKLAKAPEINGRNQEMRWKRDGDTEI